MKDRSTPEQRGKKKEKANLIFRGGRLHSQGVEVAHPFVAILVSNTSKGERPILGGELEAIFLLEQGLVEGQDGEVGQIDHALGLGGLLSLKEVEQLVSRNEDKVPVLPLDAVCGKQEKALKFGKGENQFSCAEWRGGGGGRGHAFFEDACRLMEDIASREKM